MAQLMFLEVTLYLHRDQLGQCDTARSREGNRTPHRRAL